MPKRLSRAPYAALWALLFAGQVAAVLVVLPRSVPLAAALLLVLQALKVPITTARLGDLGHAPDDVLLAFVPLANIGLWWQMLSPTPSEAVRERLRDQWVGQLTALQAFVKGLEAIFVWTNAAVPIAVGVGTVVALLDRQLLDWITALARGPAESRELGAQLLLAATGLLGLYTLVQIVKSKTATRASWLPSFLLPVPLFAWLTLRVVESTDPNVTGNPMIPLLTASLVWQISWGCIVGASLGVLWVDLAEAQHARRRLGLGEALGRIARRTADVSAPHGAATLAVFVGMQVIIPGIYYALQFAFVDAAAVLHPDVPALRRSTRLTQGIRRRVFKVYAFGFLLALLVSGVVCVGVEVWATGVTWGESFRRVVTGVPLNQLFPIDELSLASLVVVWVSSVLMMGAARVGLAHMYRERLARAEAA